MEMLKSASKITLLMFAIGLTAGLFLGKISGEQYVSASSLVMGFYFGNRKSEHQ